MGSGRSRRSASWTEVVILALILGLAGYVAFIPHIDYAYPLHVDEWVHWASANEILSAASLQDLSSPFSGGEPILNQTYELLHHLYLATFYEVTGIPWLAVFRFFPSLTFAATVLAVYILARRSGFGWEAALFASLTPTTTGILGPAFVVPMALALVLVPLALFLALHLRGFVSYLALFVLSVSLTGMHVPTLMALVLLLVPYLILNLRRNPGRSVAIMLALGIPPLVSISWGGVCLRIC